MSVHHTGDPDWCSDIYGTVTLMDKDGNHWDDGTQPPTYAWPSTWEFQNLGKKRAGSLLDGREWKEYPTNEGVVDSQVVTNQREKISP